VVDSRVRGSYSTAPFSATIRVEWLEIGTDASQIIELATRHHQQAPA
jgi:hypothetical protein